MLYLLHTQLWWVWLERCRDGSYATNASCCDVWVVCACITVCIVTCFIGFWGSVLCVCTCVHTCTCNVCSGTVMCACIYLTMKGGMGIRSTHSVGSGKGNISSLDVSRTWPFSSYSSAFSMYSHSCPAT